MKKIIGLLTILLFTTGVFGQGGGAVLCDFYQPSTIGDVRFNTSQGYLDSCTYSFWEDDKLYTLSYDSELDASVSWLLRGDNDSLVRHIYLFRLDGDTWHKASNLIKTDYNKVTDGVQSYDYYFKERRDLNGLIKGIGKSYVKKHNDIVYIRLLNFYDLNARDDNNGFYYRWDGIILIPQGDGTYIAKLNKNE